MKTGQHKNYRMMYCLFNGLTGVIDSDNLTVILQRLKEKPEIEYFYLYGLQDRRTSRKRLKLYGMYRKTEKAPK